MNQPQLQTPELVLAEVLGLFAHERGQEAFALLNQGVESFPSDAKLRFLLGSILAGQQQYVPALSQLEYAVQLAPDFEIARFQLGSLRFTSGDPAGARLAWGPLQNLADEHPLKLFKLGCEALMDDRFEESVNLLTQGIHANTENPHLTRDMQLLIDKTKELMAQNAVTESGDGAQHLLINEYQSTDSDAKPPIKH